MQKKRGSAILIAVLLVAAIGSVAFSFGRILYLQVSTAALYENGIGAYYAAESGVEEGFLRYRYNRDDQQPTFTGAIPNPASAWLANPVNVFRYNLASSSIEGDAVIGLNKNTTIVADQSSQYYDLRMGTKVANPSSPDVLTGRSYSEDLPNIEDPKYGTGDSPYFIARDSTKKIDLADALSTEYENIRLDLKPANTVSSPTVLASTKCTLFEVKVVGQRLDNTFEERKALLVNPDRVVTCPYGGITTAGFEDSLVDYAVIQYGSAQQNVLSLTNLKGRLAPTVPYKKATLYIRPIGADAAYRLSNISFDDKYLNSAYTTISSTGYYGGTTRTLETKIDHQSGSLFDLYDYVLLQGNN